jgi:hypothetical protein
MTDGLGWYGGSMLPSGRMRDRRCSSNMWVPGGRRRETAADPERRGNAVGKRRRQHHPATSGERQEVARSLPEESTRGPPKSGTATGSTRDGAGSEAWHGSWL